MTGSQSTREQYLAIDEVDRLIIHGYQTLRLRFKLVPGLHIPLLLVPKIVRVRQEERERMLAEQRAREEKEAAIRQAEMEKQEALRRAEEEKAEALRQAEPAADALLFLPADAFLFPGKDFLLLPFISVYMRYGFCKVKGGKPHCKEEGAYIPDI